MRKTLVLAHIVLAAAAGAQSTSPAPASELPLALPVPAAETGHVEIPVNRIVAVVGKEPILWSDVLKMINQRRAQGLKLPADSAGQLALAHTVVGELVDEEVLLLKAKDEKIEISDDELAPAVDRQLKRIREGFKSETELLAALKAEGFGTLDEYRRTLVDQSRRSGIQQRLLDKLRTDGKLVHVSVSEAEVTKAFDGVKGTLPPRPSTVTFRQVIVAPKASAAARAAARAKAESLLVEITRGEDFEKVARRESMDPGSRELGGDLGWSRRGVMVPEFERWLFALAPGQMSPVIETSFGYHIIKVERVQPAEVKARHILIRPRIDSANIAAAHAEADTVATLWRAGTPFDSLVARFHDPAEERSILQPFDRAQLPASYATAFAGKGAGDIVDPFRIEDARNGVPKFVVAQIVTSVEGGETTIADLRGTIREQLSQERSIRRLLDALRKDVYVDIRL